MILLLLIGAGPIIHYGSLSLVYRFLAAIAQPISDKRVVGALSTMGEGCAMLLKLLLTAEAVSYTHLDVYKRQGSAGRFWLILKWQQETGAGRIFWRS